MTREGRDQHKLRPQPTAARVMSDRSAIFKGVVKFARSATRHRISRERSRFVIAHCGLRFNEPPPRMHAELREPRIVFLGDDAGGQPLEVIAVEYAKDELFVIHAMPLRRKYRTQYEEAKRWCH